MLEKNPDLITSAVNEYLEFLDVGYRKELKEELTYNLEFKKEFRACLSELSFLLFTLENGEENMFNEYYSAFAKSTPTTNKHILKMYNFYFSSLGVEEGDFNSNIVEQMKSLFEKRKLYYNFNDNMIYSTQEESKNIKV